jgi:hypothetical protein
MIYNMAKTLGRREQQIKGDYTFAEIAERNLFDGYDNYVKKELIRIQGNG